MQKMADEYRAGPQAPAVLASGETVSIGTVLKSEIDLMYIVSTVLAHIDSLPALKDGDSH